MCTDLFSMGDGGHAGEGGAGDKPADAVVYCDGASIGNPGHAGIGIVARLPGREKKAITISEYIGTTTNNVAEYSALIRGIRELRLLGVKRVAVFLDSELLVRQLTGIYRVKNSSLKALWAEAKDILGQFDHYTITHIRREQNREADMLAKRAAKKVQKH